MAERPRELGDFKGWVTLSLNFWLKGYVLRQYLWIIRYGEWLYYNFAAGSYHTKKLCTRLYSIEVAFYSKKQQKLLLKPPFGDL